jgi:glycosyltransferase involved in cell wall biosynthesis
MKVAIDGTPLTLSSGGLARYTLQLSQALADQFPEDDCILVSDQRFDMPSPRPRNLRRGNGPRNRLEKRWWLYGVQRELSRTGAELFHGTNFMVPWLPLRPSVLTLHDLSPWLDPAWHGDARFVRGRAPRLIRLGLATMIVTPSEAVRRQAIDFFRIHPARIAAVPLAAAPHFRPVPERPRPNPYFLFVGTLEPRKNLETLLRAWREVRGRYGVELVLAGRRRADFEQPLGPEAGLSVLGEVSEETLPALYSGAVAVLYPSLYEGFGLPVVEAMQCGALVIASRDPAIREAAGQAAILLDARDAKPWVEAMTAAVKCPEGTAALRARSVEQAKSFSWDRTARLTREVYLEALRRFGA